MTTTDETTEPQISYNVVCDAVGCRAWEPIKNLAAASAAFDGGPDWVPDPIWFPEGWEAPRVRLNAEVKRIYGTARLSEIVAAGGLDPTPEGLWTFTLCPTHKDVDPVLRNPRLGEPGDDDELSERRGSNGV